LESALQHYYELGRHAHDRRPVRIDLAESRRLRKAPSWGCWASSWSSTAPLRPGAMN